MLGLSFYFTIKHFGTIIAPTFSINITIFLKYVNIIFTCYTYMQKPKLDFLYMYCNKVSKKNLKRNDGLFYLYVLLYVLLLFSKLNSGFKHAWLFVE